MTTVKTEDGNHSMTLLPPRPGVCQTCATDHPVQYPHNAQSLFYQTKFQMENGRSPTWHDAMSHCDKATKRFWIGQLKAAGVNIVGGKINPEAKDAKKKSKD